MKRTTKISPESHLEPVNDSSQQSDTLPDEEIRELLDYFDDVREILLLQEDSPFGQRLKRVSLKR